jgi:DNA-binding MarR family transcriptional regulator
VDSSPVAIVGRVSRLARALERELDTVYDRFGLDGALFDVLATHRRQGAPYALRASELADQLMLTASGTTKRLDRLEREGLVEREACEDDRRGVSVRLTAKGRRLIDTAYPEHMANEARLLGGLTKAERRELATLLRKLAESVA